MCLTFFFGQHFSRCLGVPPRHVFYIPLVADVLTLQQLRQQQIDQRLLRQNRKRKACDCTVGDRVLIRNQLDSASKLKPTYKGPFSIARVHTNGTVTVQLQPHVQDRYNIRLIRPYRESN